MSESSTFEFSVDKVAQTVTIVREFDADLDLVWEAFTTAEILDQWVAPKPFAARTKCMNFEVGGRRFYAMVSPEGHERWLLQKYTSITPKTNFKLFNTFADENENAELIGSEWDYSFVENNGKTTVTIVIYNESLERMERMMELGFKEGFTLSMDNLIQLLSVLKK